jgi:hypothetical protein
VDCSSKLFKRKQNMHRQLILFIVFLSACVALPATQGFAIGAVAVGVPGNVAKDGVAQGFSFDAKTEDGARATAMRFCQDVTKSSKEAVALCKVVKVFHDQCVAGALDPKPGTPGFGWAVDDDKDGAEKAALAMCIDSAGVQRRKFCKIVASDCDPSPPK